MQMLEKAQERIMRKHIGALAMSAREKFCAFRKDQSGSILQMTGLSIIPIMLAAGVAIDTSRVNFAHQKLAAGLDAGALAAAAMANKSEADMQTEAKKYLDSNFLNNDTITIQNFKLTNGLTTVVFEATARVPTTIMRISGTNYVDVKLSSEVTKSGQSVEVALLLDNTGSMTPSMSALQTAAKSFVEKVLAGASAPYYAKIAIVPYSMGVNVGGFATAARGTIASGTSSTPGSAQYTFKDAYYNSDKTLDITTCVSERTGAQKYTDAAVASNPVGRVYAGSNNPCLSSQLLPLTSTKSTIDASIDAMAAGGSSAGQVGIAWGLYTLSPNFGLWSGASVPAAYNAEKLRKVVVLMTDGEYNSAYCNDVISGNPQNSGSGSPADHTRCAPTNDPAAPTAPIAPTKPGKKATQAQKDAYAAALAAYNDAVITYDNDVIAYNARAMSSYVQSKALCEEIKAKGIEIYTIEFELNTAIAQRVDLVQSCATDADHRVTASDSTQLQAAFTKVANSLKDLRVSK
jgi:Flp pilus assembly protein TadG